MTSTATPVETKPTNPYAAAYKNFREQTKNHHLVVLHDQGLYRHLRIQEPGTRMWSWDLNTWPGHLATSGDVADGFVFTRELDMIGFFADAGRNADYYSDGAPSIDVRYWAEKLCGRDSINVKVYSDELFLQHVDEALAEHETLGDEAQTFHERQRKLLEKVYNLRGLTPETLEADLVAYWLAFNQFQSFKNAQHSYTLMSLSASTARNASRAASAKLWSTEGISAAELDLLVDEYDWHEFGDSDVLETAPVQQRAEILEEARWSSESEHQAREWLSEQSEIFGEDTWEWNLREYDTHFLFTCYCIDLGVQLYRQHLVAKQATDSGKETPA